MISSDKVDWLVLSLSYWDFYLSSNGGTCGDPSAAIRMNECDYGSSMLGKVLIPRAEAQLKGYADHLTVPLISKETIFNAIVSWKAGLFLLRSILEVIEALPSDLAISPDSRCYKVLSLSNHS